MFESDFIEEYFHGKQTASIRARLSDLWIFDRTGGSFFVIPVVFSGLIFCLIEYDIDISKELGLLDDLKIDRKL